MKLQLNEPLRKSMLLLGVIGIIFTLLLPCLGIMAVVVALITEKSFLLYLGIPTILLGGLYMVILLRYISRIRHNCAGIILDSKGVQFIHSLSLKRQFIPWDIVSELSVSVQRKHTILLYLSSDLTDKEIRRQVSGKVYRRIKKREIFIPNSTVLSEEELYRLMEHWWQDRSASGIPEITVYQMDNQTFTRSNMIYNIGLASVVMIWLFIFFAADAVMHIPMGQLIPLHGTALMAVVALRLFSIRIDGHSPRKLHLTKDSLSYFYVSARTRTRRTLAETKILRAEITSLMIEKKRISIYKSNGEVIILDKVELSSGDKERLQKEFNSQDVEE